jgi:glycine dehydrogenase subunit 1
MPYIPHTKAEKESMLASIGVSNTDALFDEIPAHLLYSGFQDMPQGLSEMSMLKEAQRLAHKNHPGICFIGAGAYEHHIPAAVWELTTRGEFYTAYTPYQAEASQGTLQLLYEFQSMIADLTGMEVANASLYDGATALAEAVLMAIRINKHSKTRRILVAGTVHPLYRETLETIASNQHIEIITLDFDKEQGITPLSAIEAYNGEDSCALVIAQPNFFGCLEAVDAMVDWAHKNQIISIASVNPTSLALLKPPGAWGKHGVDIVCGEGQPLGIPLASGGPYFGFFSTRMEYVRQMPGRLVGLTVDSEGKEGFTLTLQAREQHIRRGKATSNICTNQGLMVTAATIYMSLIGTKGLEQVAKGCFHNTHTLVDALTQIPGVELAFKAPYFHEALLKLNKPVEKVLQTLAKEGIFAGLSLNSYYPELRNTVLVCATEVRTPEEITYFRTCLEKILKEGDA